MKSALARFLYLRDAYGICRTAIGAGRAVLRRIAPAEPSPKQEPAKLAPDHVELHGSVIYTRNDWDTGIAYETLEYMSQLEAGGLTEFRNVLDIGAHIGSFSVHLAKRSNIFGKIYAIEPSKSNYDLIWRNVEANSLATKIKPINAAASFRDGTAILVLDSENTGGHHLSTYLSGRDEQVRTIDVATLFDSTSPIDLIKIDCEGWEFPIFRRLNKRLRSVKTIVGEFHRSNFSNPEHQQRYLERHGFQVSIFAEGDGIKSFFARNLHTRRSG